MMTTIPTPPILASIPPQPSGPEVPPPTPNTVPMPPTHPVPPPPNVPPEVQDPIEPGADVPVQEPDIPKEEGRGRLILGPTADAAWHRFRGAYGDKHRA
jgi:hypothetical protein